MTKSSTKRNEIQIEYKIDYKIECKIDYKIECKVDYKIEWKNRDQNYKSSVFTQSATQHLQAIDARSKSILKIKIDYKKLMVRQLINKIS